MPLEIDSGYRREDALNSAEGTRSAPFGGVIVERIEV
jgi:hypothetical protein